MEKTFLKYDKPFLTTMVQGRNPDRIKELIDLSVPEGAEAFGMQFCQMEEKYKTREVYEDLFSYTDKPTYVTNYRYGLNAGKSDEKLGEELCELAEYGATLCDMMGDYFDRQPDELARDERAIDMQMRLIEKLHKNGAEVLMSSHVHKFLTPERVLEIALEHQRRGADICKIVVHSDDSLQECENLKMIAMLKSELKIPFLFLSGGSCRLIRRIGGELGCCMYLCVHEYDSLATRQQPLLKYLKAVRDNIQDYNS